MTEAEESHRLDGLEPDNLLAFLALLGLLRALEADDAGRVQGERFFPRASFSLDEPPLRPVLHLARAAAREEIAEAAARGLEIVARAHDFDGRADLNYKREEAREELEKAALAASPADRARADILAALMSDAAIKDGKDEVIEPTPLCLLFGQGRQHFLERFARVPNESVPPARGKGKRAENITAAECLAEALFEPWRRNDPTPSFRWDPEEDVRYALMAGDPTDAAFKSGTQHGANRLASVGLCVLTVIPEWRAGRVRPAIPGGAYHGGSFSFAWPLWRGPATLAAIRALLNYPDLRDPAGFPPGAGQVLVARRVSVGKFMNFSRARPPAS